MHIRRPLAGLLVALTLFGGGATLTACGDPAGTDRNDGTTDDSSNTSGNAPSDSSQGNLPDNSNEEPGSSETGPDAGNG